MVYHRPGYITTDGLDVCLVIGALFTPYINVDTLTDKHFGGGNTQHTQAALLLR